MRGDALTRRVRALEQRVKQRVRAAGCVVRHLPWAWNEGDDRPAGPGLDQAAVDAALRDNPGAAFLIPRVPTQDEWQQMARRHARTITRFGRDAVHRTGTAHPKEDGKWRS